MTDLEMTNLCAEAMGYPVECPLASGGVFLDCVLHNEITDRQTRVYDPLHDDAQAMALVKKFQLTITIRHSKYWRARTTFHPLVGESDTDLNRAIVETVAEMTKARTLPAHPSTENTDSV